MKPCLNLYKLLLCILTLFASCTRPPRANTKEVQTAESANIVCTDSACFGTYRGPEFVFGSDVAHQFSNKMANAVGNKLKSLYAEKKYVKVNLKHIRMTTDGMNKIGNVVYALHIPFLSVKEPCEAFTSFDHRGGWGHTPRLNQVLADFAKVKGLHYQFHTTPEGLAEYWLQWKDNSLQLECLNQ